MKKNILISFLIMIFLSPAALAAKLKITAELIEPFSTEYPSRTVKARVIEDYKLNETQKIEKGSVFTGVVTEIKEPKRGKRDAHFYLRLTSYSVPSKDNAVYDIKNTGNATAKATIYKPLDKKELALDAGATTAGFFIDYIALPVNFTRGVVEPYEGKGRVESGVQKMYEKSIFSYLSEGKQMQLNKGDKINLTFKYKKD